MHRATVEDAATMVEEALKVCACNHYFADSGCVRLLEIGLIEGPHIGHPPLYSDGFMRLPNKPIKTKEGKQRLKFQMQLYYGKTLFESWTDGNKLQASIAPMFKGADEESVTMATAMKMLLAKKSDLSAAVRQAVSQQLVLLF